MLEVDVLSTCACVYVLIHMCMYVHTYNVYIYIYIYRCMHVHVFTHLELNAVLELEIQAIAAFLGVAHDVIQEALAVLNIDRSEVHALQKVDQRRRPTLTGITAKVNASSHNRPEGNMNVQGATALKLNAQHVLIDTLEELVGPQKHVKDSSEHIIQVQSEEPGAVLEVLAIGKTLRPLVIPEEGLVQRKVPLARRYGNEDIGEI